jgi:hypothetical protein
MKITYLDQLHWIELASAIHGGPRFPEMPAVLEALRHAQASGYACFPLSYAHYRETRKRRDSDQRLRLAKFMSELSGSMTVAPLDAVIAHEIEVALGRCFPGRVVPEPFQFRGRGAAHAFNTIPAPLRPAVEAFLGPEAELSHLSGSRPAVGPLTDLSRDSKDPSGHGRDPSRNFH